MASETPKAQGQSTEIATEYLMTYVAPLEAHIPIDDSMVIINVLPGGWVKGPKISGRFVAPGGDWITMMPSGAWRLDVRGIIQTDDGAHLFISYNGILQPSEEILGRLRKGDIVTNADFPYFITAPTIRTSAEKYAWLNSVQLAGKLIEMKLGEYIKYDVFVLW